MEQNLENIINKTKSILQELKTKNALKQKRNEILYIPSISSFIDIVHNIENLHTIIKKSDDVENNNILIKTHTKILSNINKLFTSEYYFFLIEELNCNNEKDKTDALEKIRKIEKILNVYNDEILEDIEKEYNKIILDRKENNLDTLKVLIKSKAGYKDLRLENFKKEGR